LDMDGNVYGWGNNNNKVVSPQAAATSQILIPRNISNANTILKNSYKLVGDKAGTAMHVLKRDGQVVTWGSNARGVYGIGDLESTLPSRALLKERALAVFAGPDNIGAILINGDVDMWGDLGNGQLGYGADAADAAVRNNGDYRAPVKAYNFSWRGDWNDETGTFNKTPVDSFPLGGDISTYVQVFYRDGGDEIADYGEKDAEGNILYTADRSTRGNLWAAGAYGSPLGRDHITTGGTVTVQVLDENGDPALDENGQPIYVEQPEYIANDGSVILGIDRVMAGKSDIRGGIKNVMLVTNGIFSSHYPSNATKMVGERSIAVTNNGAVWSYGENETGLLGDNTNTTRYTPVRTGVSYFKFSQFTYSMKKDGVLVLENPPIASFNLLEGASGTPSDEYDLIWQTWNSSSDASGNIVPNENIVSIDYLTPSPAGKRQAIITANEIGTTYVIVSLKDDAQTVGSFRIEVRPNDEQLVSTGLFANAADAFLGNVAYPQVVTGANTTYALKPDGTVWAWGSNEYGQLGNGKIFGTAIYPQQVEITKLDEFDNTVDVRIKKLAAGAHSVLAVDTNGEVWAWGRNDKGQLGIGEGTAAKISTPQRVLKGTQASATDYLSNIVDVATGGLTNDEGFSLFLSASGIVYGTGDNTWNQVSSAHNAAYFTPVRLTDSGAQIAIGQGATAHVLRMDGSVFSMGKGNRYEYGIADYEDTEDYRTGKAELDGFRALTIGAGQENTLAVIYNIDQLSRIDKDRTGALYAWGANNNHEFGAMPETLTAPTRQANVAEAMLTGGGRSIFAVQSQHNDADGTDNEMAVMGGLASSGQLGIGTVGASTYPISDVRAVIQNTTNLGATSADADPSVTLDPRYGYEAYANNIISMSSAVGGAYSAYANRFGDVWAFGKNDKGQLSYQDVTADYPEASLVGADLIVELTTGNEMTLRHLENSEPIGVSAQQGFNLYRNPSTNATNTFESLDPDIATVDASTGVVTAVGTGKTYIKVTTTTDTGVSKTMYVHVYALPDDSDAMGKQEDGSYLYPEEMYVTYPQIAAGENFMLALRANGEIYAWGDNTYGQLGLGLGRLGSIDMKPQKVTVTNADGSEVKFKKIAAGADFSMAVDVDGNLYTWGRNNNGQLGNGLGMYGNEMTVERNAEQTIGVYIPDAVTKTYTSSNTAVATVTDEGVVKGIKTGKAFIEIASTDSNGTKHSTYVRVIVTPGGGKASTVDAEDPGDEVFTYVPTKLDFFIDDTDETGVRGVIQDISAGGSAGNSFAMALTRGGDVFTWGSNLYRQVSTENTKTVTTPTIASVSRITSISAGSGDKRSTAYGVQETGKVVAWGSSKNHEFAEGVTDSVTGQAVIRGNGFENDVHTLEVAAGDGNAVALTTTHNSLDKAYYAWGSTESYIVPDTGIYAPQRLDVLNDTIDVTNGDGAIFVQKDGSIMAAGYNNGGKLANDTNTRHIMTIRPVDGVSDILTASVSAGGQMSGFITRDGSIKTVGNNARGQLGDAILTSSASLVDVYSGVINVTGEDGTVVGEDNAIKTKLNLVDNITYFEKTATGKVSFSYDIFNALTKHVPDATFRAMSLNPAVADITSSGELTYKNVGSTRMIVSLGGTDKYALFDVNVLPETS
ncbi:MAG: Ig-like domain-containing protein, partial [Clostridia bacterium]|nr:Ig-like domain-containing protein [Clostridia bacterium]